MARATIADVAKLAGVSQATVSRALRGVDKVTPATRRKVLDAADRLNFTLLKSASALASGKTMRIILLSSGRLNEWFNANVLQGAYEVLTPEGYDVSPAFIIGKEQVDRYFAELPKNRNADAIIISSFQLDGAMREQLKAIDMPTIGVNIPSESSCDASVGIDNFDGMSKAVRLLKSLGHERIAFAIDYIPQDMVYNTSQRTEAFLEAVEQNGYGEDEVTIVSADEHPESMARPQLAAELVAKLLSLPQRPTAVCVETDQVAIALIKELKRQHLRVPEDMSVIGFDDAEIAEVADLTTIRQNPLELGRSAARKTLQLLKGEPLDDRHESQEPVLVLRDTTGRAPQIEP
ncbi:LacI family DNA-binding transcriptional regulator [Bifidobacterium sp. 64T4]|uniref:LacI family DNA-binding transcriptional regulator n=1 Tax=Bifidobacterium pongonis TaxID=2834432 RepID=UPI001C58095B|nr:LacI family DNA-binding transcriptional regulator [Bifidobacterium pongonis]MBW3094336.1 LacI family DNA-binding transcriptional regulator [Bifidobacterium pongonis]